MTTGMRYVFLDTETTGLSRHDEVIQIGGIVTDDKLNVLKVFEEYCWTNRPIPPEAVKVHGITRDVLLKKSEETFLEQHLNGGRLSFLRETNQTFVMFKAHFDIAQINQTLVGNNCEEMKFGERLHVFDRKRVKGRYHICAERLFSTVLKGGSGGRLEHYTHNYTQIDFAKLCEMYDRLRAMFALPADDKRNHNALFDAFVLWYIVSINRMSMFI
jgi:hypothetical protein